MYWEKKSFSAQKIWYEKKIPNNLNFQERKVWASKIYILILCVKTYLWDLMNLVKYI